MVGKEHAVEMDLFVYTRFHSGIEIPSNSQETSLKTYTHIFNLEVMMVEMLKDLNLKLR